MKPGQILAKIVEFREEKASHTKEASRIGGEIDKLQTEMIEQCDKLGTDQIREFVGNIRYTASVTEEELPVAEDWEKIYRWIKRNPQSGFALLRRQLNTAPYRDLLHIRGGRPIPGVGSYIKRGLSVKKTGVK